MSWTQEDAVKIEQLCCAIAGALQQSGASAEICASALMTTTARLCVLSLESDDHMIDQFRKTLLANRQLLEKVSAQ